MGAVRPLTGFIRSRGRRLLFLFVVFQLPLFRTGCATGTCEAPLHVMLGGVDNSTPLPSPLLSALLLPGALLRNARELAESGHKFVVPSLSTVEREFNFTVEREIVIPGKTFRLEIVIASYLVVAGAVQCLFQPGRLAFLGSLLTGWAWIRARLGDQENEAARPDLYPTYFLFLVLSFFALPIVENGGKRRRPATATVAAHRKKEN